jgi:hypothetical protein
MEVGTLRDLNVKPGDRLRLLSGHFTGTICTVRDDLGVSFVMTDDSINGYSPYTNNTFRLLSRAADSFKIWGDLTDEEQGALLLAYHRGKTIQTGVAGSDSWYDCCNPNWSCDTIYRVKPEPTREKVVLYGFKDKDGRWYFETGYEKDDHHSVCMTFYQLDGEPDLNSIKLEKL